MCNMGVNRSLQEVCARDVCRKPFRRWQQQGENAANLPEIILKVALMRKRVMPEFAPRQNEPAASADHRTFRARVYPQPLPPLLPNQYWIFHFPYDTHFLISFFFIIVFIKGFLSFFRNHGIYNDFVVTQDGKYSLSIITRAKIRDQVEYKDKYLSQGGHFHARRSFHGGRC